MDDILNLVRLHLTERAAEVIQVERVALRTGPPLLGEIPGQDQGLDLGGVQLAEDFLEAGYRPAALLEFRYKSPGELEFFLGLEGLLDFQGLLEDPVLRVA